MSRLPVWVDLMSVMTEFIVACVAGYYFSPMRMQILEGIRDQSYFKLEGGVEEKLFFIPNFFADPH